MALTGPHVRTGPGDVLGPAPTRAVAGLTPLGHDSHDTGRRFCFLDPDGTDHAVVSDR